MEFPAGTARPLHEGEHFSFHCHPSIGCFNECCRDLELALSPYDVLRLKDALAITSSEFFDRHGLAEEDSAGGFPRLYLAMVDDGRASCPFLSQQGCRVYANRPAACRIYPVGRGSFLAENGDTGSIHILLREQHCHGHREDTQWSAEQWFTNQGLDQYTRWDDACLPLFKHPALRQGRRLTAEEISLSLLALYDLDEFRRRLQEKSLACPDHLATGLAQALAGSDEDLLRFALTWLDAMLFYQ